MATLMERFNWMVDKLEEQERGRKGKEGEGTKRIELSISSENSPGIKTGSREIERGGGFDGGWRPGIRSRRLEMPVFEGLDPDGWIYKAERYFAINQIVDKKRMEAIVVCLDGEALAWFQWEKKRRKLHSWEELKISMLERFRPSQEGSLEEKFLAFRQEGSVRDYRRWFETLASPLEEMPESILEGNFINRLRPEI
ncbi:Mediator of RNA polymerase II transcription subunit 25 [Abeliophyllum distichum]|uniref:Mediator of RNA polymerase II transcription subunit 25 n=1 Tax=Abeliophyllum distichum TaxID=126358 RepID=A0ABD1PA40_9LAMI